MNMLAKPQYQFKLSSITNVAPVDQPIRLQYSHQIKLFWYDVKDHNIIPNYPKIKDLVSPLFDVTLLKVKLAGGTGRMKYATRS